MPKYKITEKNKPIKIVLDTNILISGFLNPHNPPGRILFHLTEPGLLKLLISDEILAKYEGVLKRKKFNLDKSKIIYALTLIENISIKTTPKEKLNITDDKDDNKFFECAIEGNADFLISGDIKHVQKIKKYKGIKVISPAEFINILKKNKLI